MKPICSLEYTNEWCFMEVIVLRMSLDHAKVQLSQPDVCRLPAPDSPAWRRRAGGIWYANDFSVESVWRISILTESYQAVPNYSHQRKMESYYILVLIAGILVAFVLLVLIVTDHNFFKAEIPPDVDQPEKLCFYHCMYTMMEILVSLSCSGILGFSGKLKLEYEDMHLNTAMGIHVMGSTQ